MQDRTTLPTLTFDLSIVSQDRPADWMQLDTLATN